MNNDFLLLMPMLLVGIGGIGLMIASTYESITHERMAISGMGLFGVAFLFQLGNTVAHPTIPYEQVFNGMLVVSDFTRASGMIILGCGLATCMSAYTYFKQNPFCTSEFYSLIAFSACGMLLLTMAQELISVFIALEIMSLAIYILVGYNRQSQTATEAVLKYLMLGAFAGAFFTMGAALIYGGAGSTKFTEISASISANGYAGNAALIGGSFLVIVAFLFKVAAFPFHAWVTDVYEGASTPITGFMATALKTAVFAVFANFLVLNNGLHEGWINGLFYISILTMFVGNLVAIGQESLKRMLAASGIVHSGYLLIALVAINTEQFTGGVIAYYLAAYSVGTLGIFAALSYLGGEDEKRMNFADFKGLAKVRPYSAAAITIFLLSMAGIPPTAGFMGKFYIITSAISAGQIALAVFGIISSILSMWYYLRLIVNMYFHDAVDTFETDTCHKMAPVCTMVLALCVFAIGLYPIII
ncbi:NADH-quinone oxidoreductase subunit N [Desulfogranum japonicum]|uniref:NADH-quinone oxidoreductase subunit N n=1 Tax=Desulfogranum japonicum TaxID=231447 RepID=UPI00042595DD|nr:NADH-quinone oxidoreductase subunit N [Desulfogranum japonicum]